jgi:hypothetical protein
MVSTIRKNNCSLENDKPIAESPRDCILWILANNGGKMERSKLRATTG